MYIDQLVRTIETLRGMGFTRLVGVSPINELIYEGGRNSDHLRVIFKIEINPFDHQKYDCILAILHGKEYFEPEPLLSIVLTEIYPEFPQGNL